MYLYLFPFNKSYSSSATLCGWWTLYKSSKGSNPTSSEMEYSLSTEAVSSDTHRLGFGVHLLSNWHCPTAGMDGVPLPGMQILCMSVCSHSAGALILTWLRSAEQAAISAFHCLPGAPPLSSVVNIKHKVKSFLVQVSMYLVFPRRPWNIQILLKGCSDWGVPEAWSSQLQLTLDVSPRVTTVCSTVAPCTWRFTHERTTFPSELRNWSAWPWRRYLITRQLVCIWEIGKL